MLDNEELTGERFMGTPTFAIKLTAFLTAMLGNPNDSLSSDSRLDSLTLEAYAPERVKELERFTRRLKIVKLGSMTTTV